MISTDGCSPLVVGRGGDWGIAPSGTGWLVGAGWVSSRGTLGRPWISPGSTGRARVCVGSFVGGGADGGGGNTAGGKPRQAAQPRKCLCTFFDRAVNNSIPVVSARWALAASVVTSDVLGSRRPSMWDYRRTGSAREAILYCAWLCSEKTPSAGNSGRRCAAGISQ